VLDDLQFPPDWGQLLPLPGTGNRPSLRKTQSCISLSMFWNRVWAHSLYCTCVTVPQSYTIILGKRGCLSFSSLWPPVVPGAWVCVCHGVSWPWASSVLLLPQLLLNELWPYRFLLEHFHFSLPSFLFRCILALCFFVPWVLDEV
jgi:hypothetical protein